MNHTRLSISSLIQRGENGIYRVTKAWESRRKDLGFVQFIRDADEWLLVRDDDIICRWYNYCLVLFNEVLSTEGASRHV